MVAPVAVHDINVVNFVKVVLQGIGRKNTGDSGVKAAAQKGRDAGLLKTLPIGPLPGIIKIGREALLPAALLIYGTPLGILRVLRLVIGRVDVIHPAGKAGIHDGQILIGQRQVQHRLGSLPANQRLQLLHIVRIHLRRGDFCPGSSLQLRLQFIAFTHCAASNADLREHIRLLCAFLNGHGRHAPAAYNQYFRHFPPP